MATGPAAYEEAFALYEDLLNRSLQMLEVAPQQINFNQHPELSPATLEHAREASRNRAVELLLKNIDQLRPAAQTGAKTEARKAWKLHERVAHLAPKRAEKFAEERQQLKEIGTVRVHLYARINLYPYSSDSLVHSEEVKSFYCWTNEYSEGHGDRRALPAFANSGFSWSPPNLETLLARARADLPGRAQRELWRLLKRSHAL